MEKFEFKLYDDESKIPTIQQKGKYAEYLDIFIHSPNKVMEINCVTKEKANRFYTAACYYKNKRNLDFTIMTRNNYLYLVKP